MMMGAEPTRDVFDEVRRTLDGDTEPSRTLGGMTPGERLRAEIGALNDRLVFLESEHLRSRERLEHMARALTAAGVDPATV